MDGGVRVLQRGLHAGAERGLATECSRATGSGLATWERTRASSALKSLATQNGQKIGMKITPSTQKIRFSGNPTLIKSTKR